ncbi:hypothetical protein QBC45DRAFT_160806 [Copromyces sp. CBS 386.78]|nr:hypothetical protein QBC45DRAFT_160806 [Copromyces sp. CBS 386.78]
MSTNLEMEPRARDSPVEPVLANNHADQTAYQIAAAYQNHPPSPSGGQGDSRTSPIAAVPPALPHGYNNHPAAGPHEAHLHPELRTHEAGPTNEYQPVAGMMPVGVPPQPEQQGAMPGPTTPVGVPQMGMTSPGDSAGDGKKSKRELSQSKRAAQNRAAQRAFRQRKEGYIKKLEQQVREYSEMEMGFKALQNENYALRDYILHLQNRLIDVQGDYPQPPPNITLATPHTQQLQQQQPPPPAPVPQGMAPDPVQAAQQVPPVASAPPNSLEEAAQAVAGLSRSDHHMGGTPRDPYGTAVSAAAAAAAAAAASRTDEDARTAEVIQRQLQADSNNAGMPAGLSLQQAAM